MEADKITPMDSLRLPAHPIETVSNGLTMNDFKAAMETLAAIASRGHRCTVSTATTTVQVNKLVDRDSVRHSDINSSRPMLLEIGQDSGSEHRVTA